MSPLLKSLLGVSRAPFLLLPVALVACGAAASAYEVAPATFPWGRALLALLGLLTAHAAVNAINEARDMVSGIDLQTERTPFSGGSGTLPSGAFSVRATYLWAGLMLLVSVGVGIFFLVVVGPVLWPVLILGLVAVVAYTPFLMRYGFGEVFAGMGLGALPVIGTSLALNGEAGMTTFLASVPAFLMTFNLLLLNEFPDETADRAGGRRNLVILLDRSLAARIYALVALGVAVHLGAAVGYGGLPPLALVAALPTLLCVPAIRWAFARPETPVPVSALGGNVAWNLATNFVLAAALVVAMPGA